MNTWVWIGISVVFIGIIVFILIQRNNKEDAYIASTGGTSGGQSDEGYYRPPWFYA